jgi:hypothetical protein
MSGLKTTPQVSTHYHRVKNFLKKDTFDGFTNNDLFIIQFVGKGWGQDIAALSNMAEALNIEAKLQRCNREEIKDLLRKIVVRALHKKVSPYKKDPRQVKNLGRYGYYLEHLNIILGCYQSVVDDHYLELNRTISEHLLNASLKEENFHAPLLPNVRMRWSADQAAIIYSIWLFDQNNSTSLSGNLRDKWLEHMNMNMVDKETGLYCTEALGVKRYSRQPRGCALAYLIYYAHHFSPDTAKEQWHLFKEHMLIRHFGISGFREYLPSYKGSWTPDSGPIVAGIGIGASGLALKTAAAMKDGDAYQGLTRPVDIVMRLMRALMYIPLINRLARLGTDLLASSIKLCAENISYLNGR